jgi:dTDP-4-dehydrorhamnose 3,5-epimerase
MTIESTPLSGCYVIKANKFGDERGFFMESFNQKTFKEQGINFDVKQINVAKSQKNVLRGIHFQKGDHAQAKLVNVLQGAVLDVAVDLRPESPTYLQHFVCRLESVEDFFLVPRGFGHGYLTLEANTIFQYAVDNFYAPEHEGGVMYNDPKLAIDWGYHETPNISQKDLEHPLI